ncbi:Protein DMP2 [Linum perenne]
MTLSGIGNMIKMLPTGTVFMFQFLNPVLTNNGKCQTVNKYLSGALMVVCAFNCCFTSFTDSYVDPDGGVHYGIATFKGFWPKPSSSRGSDLSGYRVRVGDFFHAFLSLIVFAALSLLDSNTVSCFYPAFESSGKVLLMSLPPVIGLVSSVVFAIFPNNRHGIGYPPATAQDISKTS